MRYNTVGVDKMKKLKLYLDTSIINFSLADDISIEDKEGTHKLCQEINDGKYEAFISEVVIRELKNTPDETKRRKLLKFAENLDVEEILEVNKEIAELADRYIEEGIIPREHKDDALHLALCTVNNIDILVTWNFEHLVKHKTRIGVSAVNTRMEYRVIDICIPREVTGDV